MNNKYILLIVMFLFLIIITLVADSVVLSTTENLLDGIVIDDTQQSSSIFSMLSTFYKILTFQIPEIPFLVNVLVFYPLSIGVVYMIVDILKDLIPFT